MLPYQSISRKEDGIVIVGLGGAGASILQRFSGSSAENVRLCIMSLDERLGRECGNVEFVQLGAGLNHGLGSGGDPEVGRMAIEESAAQVDELLRGSRLLVMVVGLGGGTGSGVAPVLAQKAREKGIEILPIDSEHCAIHQCLRAGERKEVKRLILTASGGPFFGMSRDEMYDLPLSRALAHPTWKMGAKITIDSATLMNKGFEMIEAAHLFGVSADQIDVLVHRESIIHSMVEYIDNSIIAQLSVPDMRHCVQYALEGAGRAESVIEPLDLAKISKLTFARPDREAFILLDVALRCFEAGGASCAVLNAANEVAVAAYLGEKIRFGQISECICHTLKEMPWAGEIHDLEGILDADREARAIARKYLGI